MEVLDVKKVADLLDVDHKTVYRLIQREHLPAFKVGRQWRLRMSDLEQWIDARLKVREASAGYVVKQPSLFGAADTASVPAEDKAEFGDSAFSENADEPVHRWVPWVAGFSASFVSEALGRYGARGKTAPDQLTLLDPFAGVGTTLVEGLLRGHSVVGFEINPYAAEAAELKLAVRDIPADALAQEIGRFEQEVRAAIADGQQPGQGPPAGFRTRSPFFSPRVERKVLLVRDYMAAIEDSLLRGCFRMAFASQLVSFSNYTYEPSLGTRAAVGKDEVRDADVLGVVVGKLRQMLADVRLVQKRLPASRSEARLIRGSFFSEDTALPRQSVDLVVTSPPYLNNYHYIRNSRPQVYWLGYAEKPKDLKPVEHGSFGKYWQTVRGEDPIGLDFELASLSETIDFLRSVNTEKGAYGGPGWANYAASYFNDAYRFAELLRELLKPGGRAVVVLGNSILQGVEFKTDVLFGRICELLGLGVEETHLLREKRTGSSIIKSSVRSNAAREKTVLYESAVVVRAPAQA
ncbi:MAG: helix-turn-helix domain-containing protein [Candidatus Brocadiia bacterium]